MVSILSVINCSIALSLIFSLAWPVIPDDYQLLFREDFEGKGGLKQFEMTDPSSWRISKEDGNRALELFSQSEYEPRVRSPRNIAIISDRMFGSFVMEADLMQTGRSYGHRDMCLFFGMKDASNFYYTHLATEPDPHAHNIFIVNDEPRVAIAGEPTEGIEWGETPQWHKVRVERSMAEGTIKIYFDDMSKPVLEATDTHFGYGHIGFGSFDDTGRIDNIRVWGPSEVMPSGFFAQEKTNR